MDIAFLKVGTHCCDFVIVFVYKVMFIVYYALLCSYFLFNLIKLSDQFKSLFGCMNDRIVHAFFATIVFTRYYVQDYSIEVNKQIATAKITLADCLHFYCKNFAFICNLINCGTYCIHLRQKLLA